ncbi:di-trans,poly-cis-decaprenylcistransferase [Candidatus Roizmanbacteria bacterium RIFCSPLOWO2_01_FULL_42_14]|uniref:Isoprenyl transferase n=4 Tax=Candidatus Roizmaniibacteriota TaxID=1752723 RepID=A0A1F7K1U8_9BACT|nr:MAG: di-trans,poly-cis-decaprenylcistransferase [Candidatus Roizmanbacteria bacterium RIFCSPHIGHO2_02_FULL_43_11]OGK38840.1 MAG: di-trans,poly-cis-decaprenylcistransferase [Candidatus Roizmanbacteria bacterium RIFCSPHIGHO2_12_FULL_42_10]OGK52607.1 MAG: di-trans,poly-cis-decaprenylcistransferase [Candidatus Roizmanbacteria bacterium RIFCSPLOWO2_01_FULL_42_14]OGK61859.1 MAG: di-trans,poly-cis-decaprenylcistransferase [Candidatus Roizmanbacteria bacterium RIFCSPLOWO2_02_FULL_43_10]
MRGDGNVPKHIALILDGNRRWAKARGLGALSGHRTAAASLESILQRLDECGVETVTLWGFSTENWKRDTLQVKGLMKLIEEFIDKYYPKALEKQIRVVHLGRNDRLPASLLKKLAHIQDSTRHFTRRTLNLALDYGGRDEVLRAIKRLQSQGVSIDTLTEDDFNSFLDTSNVPNPEPDLIIRTGGEQRLSGFMIWQAVYAEYYFEQKLLPDITPADIDRILDNYAVRERRFGGGK